jgi:hypothetical protein
MEKLYLLVKHVGCVSVSESESEIKNMPLDEIIETQNELKEKVKKTNINCGRP